MQANILDFNAKTASLFLMTSSEAERRLKKISASTAARGIKADARASVGAGAGAVVTHLKPSKRGVEQALVRVPHRVLLWLRQGAVSQLA